MKKFIALLLFVALSANLGQAARSFNGTTDTISIPGIGNALDITTGPLTVAFWMYITANVAGDPLSKSNTSTYQWLFEYNFGGTHQISANVVQTGVPPTNTVTCATTLSLNTWYHVAITWDTSGGIYTLWLNGNSCVTVALHGVIASNAGNIFVGSFGGNSTFFQGRVAEAGVWNASLPLLEIRTLATGVPPSRVHATNLVGYWPLYGASGATVEPDASGHKFNGTITGTTSASHCPCSSPGGTRQ